MQEKKMKDMEERELKLKQIADHKKMEKESKMMEAKQMHESRMKENKTKAETDLYQKKQEI